MLEWKPGLHRWKLGFKESVLVSFSFLEEEYGFTCVQADATFVRYNSAKVFVNVYHGRGSYQLNVEIGRHEGPRKESAFSLDAVLGWRRAPEQKLLNREIPLLQSDKREGVQEMVLKMAELFRKYAAPLLRADEGSFQDFDEYCTIESIRLSEHYRMGTTRYQADMAFQNKDWAQLVKLYEPISSELSQTELAELAHAKEQLRLLVAPHR